MKTIAICLKSILIAITLTACEKKDVDLFVSMVKQNTFIEVNEEGTEAAAVTVVEIMPTSVGNPTLFEIYRPFIFAIRERTSNTLLFIGSVVNPED